MRISSFVKCFAVLSVLVLGQTRLLASYPLAYYSTGVTYNGATSFVLDAYNANVATTTQYFSMYLTVKNYYGETIATLDAFGSSDNSPYQYGFNSNGEGTFTCNATGPSGSVSSGSVNRGWSVTYAPPTDQLILPFGYYTIEVRASMDFYLENRNYDLPDEQYAWATLEVY